MAIIPTFLHVLLAASAALTVLQNGQVGIFVLAGESSTGSSILIESFAEDPSIHTWKLQNDPVMGGKSTASFHVNAARGVGVFEGEVVDVPFLHAPGFIQVRTASSSFPDVSQ